MLTQLRKDNSNTTEGEVTLIQLGERVTQLGGKVVLKSHEK